MLRFDNIPPRSAEEVNFTPQALEGLRTNKYFTDSNIIGYYLGDVIVANSGESPDTPNFELSHDIIEHLAKQASLRHAVEYGDRATANIIRAMNNRLAQIQTIVEGAVR